MDEGKEADLEKFEFELEEIRNEVVEITFKNDGETMYIPQEVFRRLFPKWSFYEGSPAKPNFYLTQDQIDSLLADNLETTFELMDAETLKRKLECVKKFAAEFSSPELEPKVMIIGSNESDEDSGNGIAVFGKRW